MMIKVLNAYGSSVNSIFKASKEQRNNPCIMTGSLKAKAKIKKLEADNNSMTLTNQETF